MRVIGKTKAQMGWKGTIKRIQIVDSKKRFSVLFVGRGERIVTSVAIKKDDGGGGVGAEVVDDDEGGEDSDASSHEDHSNGDSDPEGEEKEDELDEEEG